MQSRPVVSRSDALIAAARGFMGALDEDAPASTVQRWRAVLLRACSEAEREAALVGHANDPSQTPMATA